MKAFKIMMAVAAIAAMPMLFTSCDDDPDYWYDGWTWGDDYNNPGLLRGHGADTQWKVAR